MTTHDRIEAIRLQVPSMFKRGYSWRSRLYAAAVAAGVRCALAAGYVVVVIGAPRTGKTMILDRALPGRIVDGRLTLRLGYRPGLSVANLPPGNFGIDDVFAFDPLPLEACLRDVADRSYVLTLDRPEDLQQGVAEVVKARKRIEITLSR